MSVSGSSNDLDGFTPSNRALDRPLYNEDPITTLTRKVTHLQARNDTLKDDVKSRASENRRLQTEHQALMAEFEAMLSRVREVRAHDRAALLEKDEDMLRLQERLSDVEEHNRLQAEQLSKLTASLRDAIKEKDTWAIQDRGDEGRKERLLTAKEAMIESGSKRVQSLTRQLTALRNQFDAVRGETAELRRSLAERNDDICALQAKVSTNVFAESDRWETLEAERRAAEDTIHSMNANNRRLLMLLATPPPPSGWGSYLCYSGVANEMVYIGDEATQPAEGPPGMSHVLTELHAAVEAYNHAQVRVPTKKNHVNDRAVVATREKDYWIPNDVFVLVSSFKHRYFPEASVDMFYDLLIEINKVWRSKAKKQRGRSSSVKKQQQHHHLPLVLDVPAIRKEVAQMQRVKAGSGGPNAARLWESATSTIQVLLTRIADLEALPRGGSTASTGSALQYVCRRIPDVLEETTTGIDNVVEDCLKCLSQVPQSTTSFALLDMQRDFLKTIQRSFMECRRNVLDAVTRAQSTPLSHGYPASLGDLYGILGVPRESGQDVIKSRYKKLARELHPDSTEQTNREKVRKQFIAVTEAYEILSDVTKRASYDKDGGNEYQDHQENRQYLRNNLFGRDFDGVEIDSIQLDSIWKNTHPDRKNSYAVFFWSNNFPDCVDAAVPWRLLATRMKGTSLRVASLRCDNNIQSCRRLNLDFVPGAFFFSEGQKTKFQGKFEIQQLIEAAVPFVRVPKNAVKTGTSAIFERCAVVPLTLDMYWSTKIHRIILDLVTFEYTPCYDCGTEMTLMAEMMSRISPVTVFRTNCEDLDSEVCQEYGKRNTNRAWSIGHVEIQTAATCSPKKGILTSKQNVIKTTWFSGKHSSAEYVRFVIQFKRSSAPPLDSLVAVKKSDDAYAIAFYDSFLGDSLVHFEMFAKQALESPITYEKNPKQKVIVGTVDCALTPLLCHDIPNRPTLAVYPFGAKAKTKPPFFSRLGDVTQMHEAVTRDATPLRLYVLTKDTFHQKVVRTGNDPKAIKPWFVLFNAGQWCPPCNQMRLPWKQLARNAQVSTDPAVRKLRVAEVDCDAPPKQICRDLDINNYPTMVYYQGDKMKIYDGDREPSAMLDWVSNAIDNPVESPTHHQLQQIYNSANSKPYAILFNAGAWCPPCMEIIAPWRELARILPKDVMGIGSINCDENRDACHAFDVDGFPAVMILRPSKSVPKVVMPSSREKNVGVLLDWFRKYFPNLPQAGQDKTKRLGP